MIRRPLRPLARILPARARGEELDTIEAEAHRLRREADRDRARQRAEGRLIMLALMFFVAFTVIGARMGLLAASRPIETQAAAVTEADPISGFRADITDRRGRVLATNIATNALYAQPPLMVDPARAAERLAAIFPDENAETLLRRFTDPGRRFLWLRRQLSPEQVQAVHDIGEPGLLFGPREMRLYPNGTLAAHVLGGASFGREGVRAAEVIGTAGIERALDEALRAPGAGPLRLSLDLTVQAATEEVLATGMALLNARGATAVVMDIDTGEIVALASLPSFDPNARPAPPVTGDPADSPLFNRAVQGLYELGSTFKVFAVAQALELGLVTPGTMIDTTSPMTWGRFRISDFHDYGPRLSVTDVIVKSSNVGTARIAAQIGAERQRAFLGQLGLLAPTALELVEAPGARPQVPANWSEISTLTIGYGHGLSTSPLHLAAAYASVLNGGTLVRPTLVAGAGHAAPGPRVVSEATSAIMRDLLRQVVTRGTASFAEVPGYAVGGKTGTADKVRPTGGYYDDRVIATFAGIFPADAPQYVVVVTLDEPVETSGTEPRRTAGWTAVPVAAEVIRRIGPLLGVRPRIASTLPSAITRVSN